MDIRVATRADAAAIAAIYAPIVTDTTISFEELPPDEIEMARRINSQSPRHPWLVAVDSGVIGYAYASELRSRAAYRWSAESTVYVDGAQRDRGVGSLLYRALLERLKANDFHAVFAGIALPNDASIALHQAQGFEPVGVYREVGFKFGEWIDTSWWQILLSKKR